MSLAQTDPPRRTVLRAIGGSALLAAGPTAASAGPPALVTRGATGVFHTAATLKGELRDLDGADEAEVYFEYRIANEDDARPWDDHRVRTTEARTLSEPGEFGEHVYELHENAVYEYRAVAEVGGTRVVGDEGAFYTVSL